MKTLPLSSATWHFRELGTATWLPARVPGGVHTDLRRARKIPDPFGGVNELALQWIEERDWEYRATFAVDPDMLAHEQVELIAEGLDTVATVYLNGRKIAESENMFVGHTWSVRRQLCAGRNELRIVFGSALEYIRTRRRNHRPAEFNDPVGGCTRIRKQQCQFGWDWGPRFVTAGVWRDIRLEAWHGNRIRHTRIAQHHGADGRVRINLHPELAHPDAGARFTGTVSIANQPVALIENLTATIPQPSLWWPAGQGAQSLYEVTLELRDADGGLLDRWRGRIGLRTIRLDLAKDQWGRAFRFVVNGRPIFLKGACWIPAHCFVATLDRADYRRDLTAAAAANMNTIRVWGGGVYEQEAFYDLCDELGLLVWQDFMFACTLYPADRRFLSSVRAEAAYQVRRLQHRACLALWCGNNEIAGLNWKQLKDRRTRAGYERIFHDILPAAVKAHDGTTPYWPASPWRGNWSQNQSHETGEVCGDTHFWDVWHARHPVKDYERWNFRFTSEFGMQSYASEETNATFCTPADRNVFGPTMEAHQKNRAGNQIILDYISRRYRFPRNQEALIRLSQLNQAHCMQVAVEHCRRNMPRCMGTLYWQLNDCWPVTSWSSIEFTGRWKALHFIAKRFYAPALVCAHVPGDEQTTIGNYRNSTIGEVHLYTIYDAPEPAPGCLQWTLYRFDGTIVLRGEKLVALRPGSSTRQQRIVLSALFRKHRREEVYLRIILQHAGRTVCEDTVFFASPRFLALPRGQTKVRVKVMGSTTVRLTFISPVFQHRFAFELPGISHSASDNFFDLYPGHPKEAVVKFERDVPRAEILRVLRWQSLVDTYE